MKALLEKIRIILRSRRTRRMLTRSVSVVAAVVVFVTTYALVLPAITMEQNAYCEIPEHQHTDACYEEQLVCEIPEGEGHHHDASCYEKFLICGQEVHIHSPECYQQVTSEYDTGVPVTESYAAGEEGMGGSAAEEAVEEESASAQSAHVESGAEGAAPEGQDAVESGTGETVAEEAAPEGYEAGEAAPGEPVSEENGTGETASGEPAAEEETAYATDTAAVEATAAATETAGNSGTASETASADETASSADLADAENRSFESGTLTAEGDGYRITLDYTEEAKIPQNAELSVREITAGTDKEAYEACLEQAGQQVAADDKTSVDRKASRFFDIEILVRDTDSQGNEVSTKIEPSAPVSVNIQIIDDQAAEDAASADQKTGQGDPAVLHFAEEGVEQIDSTVRTSQEQEGGKGGQDRKDTGKEPEPAVPATEISFEAESFSIYGVVYTVDFHWEVDGKVYDFSMPGGGFVSFTDLVEVLGISGDTNNRKNETEKEEENADGKLDVTESDVAKKFVADVASVEFSNPDLIWAGNVDTGTTVGTIKEANGLESEYSAELTEKQIEAINNTAVESGDWALISMRPFDSEETMTVTMADGEVFTIRVTDAQIQTMFLSDSGKQYEVTVTYDEEANIPEGSTLRVTEFSEQDEEYKYARKSVLADKKARGEWVDLSSFGLAALDISILNPEGREIEPEAPVQVEIQIKELSGVGELSEVADTLAIQHHVEVEEGVVVETVFDGSDDATFELETNEVVAAEGIIVDPEHVKEEDFLLNDDTAGFWTETTPQDNALVVNFETSAFSTFTVTWNSANWPYSSRKVTVHYVDQNGRELTISNPNNTYQNLNASSISPAYLIYDIDGYEYAYTYRNRNTNGNRINPMLAKDNYNQWMYNISADSYNLYTRELIYEGSQLSNNDDIYVVYKEKNNIVQGGTPTVKQSGDIDPPVAPRINKESTPNGDDTNTLALSLISDTAKLEVEKLADVIVVFDVSGSMKTNDMGDGATRLQAAKEAVKQLANQLAEKKNSDGDPLVRMSLIQFSTKASKVIEHLTDLDDTGKTTIHTAVDNLSAGGGTNWDHALQLANEENDLDPGRATFVIFVTDGDPTYRNTRMNVTDLDLQKETNDTAYNNYGVNYPNNGYLSNNVYGPGDNDKEGTCYNAAVIQGNEIVSAGKNIYTIGISNDVTKVGAFNTAIHGNGAFLAANTSALQQAFSDIEASISGASGWGNIQMTDGITSLTNTVQKTGLVNVGGDFSYWIAPAPENWTSMTDAEKNAYKPAASDFVSWDLEASGVAPAIYNEQTGAVEWNMGSTFMPEAGVTYQVRFKVWPSQEAYDYIAKLNNGTIQYDSLPENVKAQIIKNGNTYTLKTNEPNAKTTYQTATRTGNTVTASGETYTLHFPTVKDLNLSVDKMKVKKEWVNSLDPDARWKTPVELLLTDGAGNLYKSIDLNEDNDYSAEDNFISCGLAKIENNELVIYEQGHDFKLSEPEEYAYYWNLDSQIYRPMIIDAQLTMLVKVDAPAGMGDKTYYTSEGTAYYKIGNGTYKAISSGDAATGITATNIRRSNLNLTKKVVDENGNPVITSELFTFTITVNDSQDKKVWFSVQTDANDTDTVVKNLITNADPEVEGGEKTGYYSADSGSEITVSIQPGWNLRFTNLPNGTTYTITENAKENYSFVNASIDNNGTFSVEDGTTVGTGTINESDKKYTVTYTNRAVTRQVYIQKTGQDAQTPLKGAIFSLYTKEDYEADPQEELKTGLESDKDGKIDLGRLVVGKYYLKETKAPSGYNLLTDPVEITVNANGVQYRQITNSLSLSNEGVSGGREEGYTLVVTNEAGVELPSTGGPGPGMLYLLGIMLTSLAAAGLFSLVNRNDFIFKIN